MIGATTKALQAPSAAKSCISATAQGLTRAKRMLEDLVTFTSYLLHGHLRVPAPSKVTQSGTAVCFCPSGRMGRRVWGVGCWGIGESRSRSLGGRECPLLVRRALLGVTVGIGIESAVGCGEKRKTGWNRCILQDMGAGGMGVTIWSHPPPLCPLYLLNLSPPSMPFNSSRY
jgi:hypothetical protein